MYNRIILAMLFYFAALKMHVASKDLEQTSTYTDKLLKKNNKIFKKSVEVLPQGYLIIAKQRFALNSVDAIEIIIIPSAWKTVSRPQTIADYFKVLGERLEKFASAET